MASPLLALLLTKKGRSKAKTWGSAAAGFALLIFLPMVMVVAGSNQSEATTCDTASMSNSSTLTNLAFLAKDATANAKIIADEGVKAGVGTRGVTIAIAAAMQESGLHNLDYGDRDSLGLFQQRPSSGWGTPAQIRTPALAADAFYGVAAHTHNAGLTDIAGWQTMSVAEAAQAVQRSAFPDAYAQWETAAATLAQKLIGEVPVTAPAGNLTAAGATGSCAPGVGATVSGSWALPLPAGSYTKTSPFGMRFHPILHIERLHAGQDMAAPIGTQIYSACDGKVIGAGSDTGGGGNVTSVDCGGGVTTLYMHQSKITATVGQQVTAGSPIGLVGNTGGSTGPHLHFQVEVAGVPTNPVPFMAARGITL